MSVHSEGAGAKLDAQRRGVSSLDRNWHGLSLQQLAFEPGEAPEMENAEHVVCIQISEPSTTIRWKVNGRYRSEVLGVGRACILPVGRVTVADWDQDCELLRIALQPSQLARATEGVVYPDRIELQQRRAADDLTVWHIGHALRTELETGCPNGPLFVDGLSLALAVHLMRTYSQTDNWPAQPVAGGLTPRALRQVVDYIEGHLGCELRIAELAQCVALSPYHFSRAFKASTGRTPHEFVLGRRLSRAQELLVQSTLPIADVALACGFSDQSHLGSSLRRATGRTPAAWRRTRAN